jgi:L-fuconolactonase
MMTIDAHQHFWRYDAARDGWITPEMAVLKRDFLPQELIAEMKSANIDGSIAVQADQSEQETLFLLDLAKQSGKIRGVIGWVDLRADDLPERLGLFSRFEKLRGFRHILQAEPDDQFMLRPDFIRGIGCLAAYQLTYDILVYPRQLPAAVKLVRRFPGQRFVLDHLGKPPIKSGEIAQWSAHINELAQHQNVYCKVSGMVTEADWRNWRAEDFTPYLDVVFDKFGADRVMFGSDWPVCLVAATYSQVKQLIKNYTRQFSAAVQAKIFGENALRFYGLTA